MNYITVGSSVGDNDGALVGDCVGDTLYLINIYYTQKLSN